MTKSEWRVVNDDAFLTLLLIGEDLWNIAGTLIDPTAPDTEPSGLRCVLLPDDGQLADALNSHHPQAIVTTGADGDHTNLSSSPLEVRRRWIHVGHPDSLTYQAVIDVALGTMLASDRFADEPLMSVFTPLYNTGEHRLRRAYQSLLAQTYGNWEWVLYDDSPDLETFRLATELALADARVHVFRSYGNNGVIGEVKRRACGLARGQVLVELDHDDELTPTCLADIREAYCTFPEAGFFYSDCAEIDTLTGENLVYDHGWAFGYGSYREASAFGRSWKLTNYPPVNAITIRHIVGIPNHVRAWRRSAYEQVGGFNGDVPVADDYELMLRTFLVTRMVHIRRFGYVQHIDRSTQSNTHRVRNAEIQRLVRLFRWKYEASIHDRIVQLAGNDFMYGPEGFNWDATRPVDAPKLNLELN